MTKRLFKFLKFKNEITVELIFKESLLMDKETSLIKVRKLLESAIGDCEVQFKSEPHDVIRIVVVSDTFRPHNIIKRISLVSESILDVSTTDLVDYDLIIRPFTFDEMKKAKKKKKKKSNEEDIMHDLVALN